jgi:hypothetical protein
LLEVINKSFSCQNAHIVVICDHEKYKLEHGKEYCT